MGPTEYPFLNNHFKSDCPKCHDLFCPSHEAGSSISSLTIISFLSVVAQTPSLLQLETCFPTSLDKLTPLSHRGPDNKLIFAKLINKQDTRKEGIMEVVARRHIILYANTVYRACYPIRDN